jgi:zinc/manganese transport system substrate-binding protein/manganese/iron transport system substrate-binding protein
MLIGLVVALVVTACGPGGAGSSGDPTGSGSGGSPAPAVLPTPEPNALKVVATTTVLADLVEEVGGSKVAVTSLVPKGGEVHTFDPSPSDVAAVEGAGLVVMNGLGLDDWLRDLVSSAGGNAPVVELAPNQPGVEYLAGDEEDGNAHDGEGHASETFNPHLWLNVEYAMKYVERIRDALVAADPSDAAAYAANATAYLERLTGLDAWATEQVAAIPEANRKVVSFHEAFPYMAAAYGLEIVGTVVHAPGQDPSAREIADLVDSIKASGAKAVFAEAQFSPDLAETVAQEAGVKVVTNLYNDTLGDPPVDTYEGLIRWDIDRIVEALR